MIKLLLILCLSYTSNSQSVIDRDIHVNTLLKYADSPFYITKSIYVLKPAVLTIEPGVTLKISPKVKISIEGTLIANGNKDQRIVFTKLGDNITGTHRIRSRLVAGLEVAQGWLQIHTHGQWRYVCSENREWNHADVKVACNEMGWADGQLSLSGLAENDTSHLLITEPSCNGQESSITNCPGVRDAKMGSSECNLQSLVGLHCWGNLNSSFPQHWWGLTFYNSTMKETIYKTANTRLNISQSQLNFVDILYAGVNWTNHRVSALSASPYPPIISNMLFANNAYDALNFTDIRGPADIRDTKFSNNSGHGFNITSWVGYVQLNNVTATNNTGAGGYIHITSKHWPEETPELVDTSKTMCGQGVITSSPVFPFLVIAEHNVPTYKAEETCILPITSDKPYQIVSVKLLEAIRDPTASAVITITDVSTSRILAVWNFTDSNVKSTHSALDPLIYGPLYQGVSSTSPSISITYNWKKDPKQKFCAYLRQCFRGIIQVSVGASTNPEVVVQDSLFENNVQHGLRVENLGLYAQILRSHFISNQYWAGLIVVNGSADILIHDCKFVGNDRTGLNITMEGGARIVNSSHFSSNIGYGMDVWNPTWLMTRTHQVPIENVVFLSTFKHNSWGGIRFYNSSSEMNILVNFSSFINNNRNGIEMIAAIENRHKLLTNFTVAFSNFSDNTWHAISISPIGQMTGMIINNTFTKHRNGGCIFIDNGVNFEEQRLLYRPLPIAYKIAFNDFVNNSGPFVVSVRLTQDSSVQKCEIVFNKFADNHVLLRENHLNPRGTPPAVVLLGSSNVRFTRNALKNPLSTIDIGTQMSAANDFIDASKNFWGSREDFSGVPWETIHAWVFRRLFDHESRYSLAKVLYFPLLQESNLHTKILSDVAPPYQHRFRNISNPLIVGGVIDVNVEQSVSLEYSASPYRVTRDIFVPQGVTLTVAAGVQMHFDNSIGLFVQGKVVLQGSESLPIRLDMPVTNLSTPADSSVQLISRGQWEASLGNLSLINGSLLPDDTGAVIGLLRVRLNGSWGVVCDNRPNLVTARIVCAELGLVAHPSDWEVLADHRLHNLFNDTVVMATVRCQPWQTRLEQCAFDGASEHRCVSGLVNLRCHRPGWAGLKISLTNEVSVLTGLKVARAGLFDYFDNQFHPAVQIDFHKHVFRDVFISDSLLDGVLIQINDLLSFNRITGLRSTNNMGSGAVTKTPWITFDNCTFVGNKDAGLKFDPGFSEQSLFDLRASMLKTLNLTSTGSGDVLRLGMHTEGIETLSMTLGAVAEKTEYWTELRTTDPNNQQQLMITLIDFNPDIRVENVTLFDDNYETVRAKLSDPSKGSSITWSIPNDVPRFPIISNRQFLTIRIVVNGIRSGRLAFLVQARSFLDLWNTGQLAKDTTTANGQQYYPPTGFTVSNSNLTGNQVGLSVCHYNSATDSQNRSYTARTSRLNVTIAGNLFLNNSQMAVHVPSVSPYAFDVYMPSYGDDISIESSARICRIAYNISGCRFSLNVGIFLAEHNHVPFSNNVWSYKIERNLFLDNRGSFTMSMPFVSRRFDWRYLPNIEHSIKITNNQFLGNRDLQIIIDGYFVRLIFAKNRLQNNQCIRQGLLSLRGMEKRFNMTDNVVNSNSDCQYLFEVISDSQTDGSTIVLGHINFNDLRNNSCGQTVDAAAISCYSIGVFGNQNVTVSRNVLNNGGGFTYELVGGFVADTFLDARENYWGTVSIEKIHSLIFDVNNWNNFAQVNFERFLLEDNMLTRKMYMGVIPPVVIDINKHFGGKVTSDMFLNARQEPYVVRADVTVMPGVELRIDAGVTLEMMPNVGILVLGKLVARGTVYRPIIMRPWLAPVPNVVRKRRAVNVSPGGLSPLTQQQTGIRMIAGNRTDEGFVQFFNTTARRWDYLCDDQFSREVAQVACRQMGLPGMNPKVRRSYLLDYQLYGYDNPFVTKYVWNTRYTCRGYESSTAACVRRLNYDAYQCLVQRQFVFLRCASDFLSPGEHFWGNIRIIRPGLEQRGPSLDSEQSFLEHVHISKAGLLHGELVSAIQSTHAAPLFQHISVSKCIWNGLDVIAPRQYVHLMNSSFLGNAGYGAAITVLNGYSGSWRQSSGQPLLLAPLLLSPLPSGVPGLLDMCQAGKDLLVTDRLLLYYRYSSRTVACTKLVRSTVPNKQVAVRFLQLNLFYDPLTRNALDLFNGVDFNVTEQLASVSALPPVPGDRNGFMTTRPLPSYVTKYGYDALGLQMFASPAGETHGFIVEVVTLPVTPDLPFDNVNSNTEHRIVESRFLGNEAGAVRVSGVGDANPVFDIYYNRFLDNGGPPILNLTADPVVLIRMQNCRDINVANNYFYRNRGGTEMHLYSLGGTRPITANFTNNVVVRNTHANALTLIGNYVSTIRVFRNYIGNNDCENRDLIKIQGVLVQPFSHNFISKNRANVMINISGADDISLGSQYLWNGFYDNWSINYTRSTTIYCDNSKNTFTNNYFRNLRNDYEFVVGNRSIMREAPMEPGNTCPLAKDCHTGWTLMLERDACVCYRPDKVDARFNWWGENFAFYIKSKIWEQTDNKYLIPVDYSSFHTNNKSVLGEDMYCLPTWSPHQRNCFLYFGAPLTYNEANDFCHEEAAAVLANSRDKVEWLGKLVASSQNNFGWLNKDSWNIRTWVHSYLPLVDQCPTVRHTWLEGFPCNNKVQYFCQKSPNGAYLGVQMEFVIAILVLLIIIFVIVLLLIIFWNRISGKRGQALLIRCEKIKQKMNEERNPYVISKVGFVDPVSRGSSSHLLSSSTPYLGTMKSAVSVSTRNKYDDDVMKMRMNTLDDAKESIRRPKSSSDMTYSEPRQRDMVDAAVPMADRTKKHRPHPRPKTATKNSTLNSMRSAGSMEAMYLNLGPDSQLNLSQPDVPQFANKSHSRSNLHLGGQGDVTDNPSKMNTMVDRLLDPSVPSRNRPTMVRTNPARASDSFNSSSAYGSHANDDNSHLLGARSHRGHASRIQSDESEI